MKIKRDYPVAVVTKKCETVLKNGHPWVYDTEVISLEEHENGSLADVVSEKGTYLGTGFISDKSKIRIRILSRNANDNFSEAFFARRIKYAVDYRRIVMGDDFSCCRLVFGEADALPGLTCDLYGNILVTEVLSYGMEKVKDTVYRALCSELADGGIEISGIFERNESSIRALEGLESCKGWYEAEFLPSPPSPLISIYENGIEYAVDIENGQKTGFFLDQKYNRLAVSKLAKGHRVLECFTHTGSFALNAARGGAERVTAVDISQNAVDLAYANAKRNHLDDKIDFMCADVFDLLPKLCEERADYDFVILDPPAFTKSRKTIKDAGRGYKEINFRAMKLLPRGGLLATCTCSHFMDDAYFRNILTSAASDASVSLRLIESRRQAPDHPVLMNVPETDYLKFYLFQIV